MVVIAFRPRVEAANNVFEAEAIRELESREVAVSSPHEEPLVDDKNWTLFAARVYDNPGAGLDEFRDDMRRFKYVRKLLTQAARGDELRTRLVLNHIIVLCNVLGPAPTARLLWLRMPEHASAIKPFLILLNALPDEIRNVGRMGNVHHTVDVPLDGRVVRALREIVACGR